MSTEKRRLAALFAISAVVILILIAFAVVGTINLRVFAVLMICAMDPSAIAFKSLVQTGFTTTEVINNLQPAARTRKSSRYIRMGVLVIVMIAEFWLTRDGPL